MVNEQETIIKNAMEEQNAGGSEVLEAIKEISNVTENIRDYSIEIKEHSHGVLNEMNQLDKITKEVSSKVTEASTNSKSIAISSNTTKDLSKENQNIVDKLLVEISVFKTD